MAHPLSFVAGAGFGAGIMYFFDPDCGNRRRSLIRDQMIHGCAMSRRSADVLRRDAGNRLHGVIAEVQSAVRHEQPSDDVLVERVRARIGRVVSHPKAIEVDACDGCVTLSGPVLASEVQNLVDNVKWVRGVQRVENALDVHNQPGNISALQGGVDRQYQPLDVLQQNWSPTTRAALGVAGVGLMAGCLLSRSVSSMALGTLGFGMAVRSMSRARGWNSSSGEQPGRRSIPQQQGHSSDGREQSPDLPRQAAAHPPGSAEWSQQGTTPSQSERHDASADNRRSSTGQSEEPAIHNL